MKCNKIIFTAIGLSIFTVLLFWKLTSFNSLNIDDDLYIFENPEISSGLTLSGISWAFKADLLFASEHCDYWQPVTWLSRMADIQIYGLNPGGHHLTNIILHALNVFLLLIVLYRLTNRLGISASIALIFAIHPLQVEPVAWITARKDLLSTFFVILTLWCYLNYVKRKTFISGLLVLFAFLCAVMSKPIAVCTPFALLLLDWWPLRRKMHLIEKIPLFVIAVFISLVTSLSQSDVLAHTSLLHVIMNSLGNYGYYVTKALIPFPLQFSRLTLVSERNILLHPPLEVLASSILLVMTTIVLFKRRDREPYLLFGWFWFMIWLAPSIALTAVADRFMYLPVLGLASMAVFGVSRLFELFRFRNLLAPFAIVIICSAFSALSWFQMNVWKDSFTLFSHAVYYSPHNDDAWAHLAEYFKAKNDSKRAIDYYKQAILVNPNNYEALNNLGSILQINREFEEAIPYHERAAKLAPNSYLPLYNLGNAFAYLGKTQEAGDMLLKVLELRPDMSDAWHLMGRILAREGQIAEAINAIQKSLLLNPNEKRAKEDLKLLESVDREIAVDLIGGSEEEVPRAVEIVKVYPIYPLAFKPVASRSTTVRST